VIFCARKITTGWKDFRGKVFAEGEGMLFSCAAGGQNFFIPLKIKR